MKEAGERERCRESKKILRKSHFSMKCGFVKEGGSPEIFQKRVPIRVSH